MLPGLRPAPSCAAIKGQAIAGSGCRRRQPGYSAPVETLYLLDGSNFLFRAYHALPPMTTQAGVPTGAVFGFTNMLLRLLDDHHPTHLAVIFDAGGRSKRTELYAEYKANRAETPMDLVPQFNLTRRLVGALGVRVLDARDVEADDLIATLARQAQRAGMRVVIVSSDKDLMQMCCADIVLLDTMKDSNRGLTYGPAEVVEKFGVPPDKLGDVLALMGDSVDNVPGVRGIGPKTAAQLINDFGSLDGLLGRIDEVRVRGADKIKAALLAGQAALRLSRQLVTLDEDVPTQVKPADLLRSDPDMASLEAILRELEFHRLLTRLSPQAAPTASLPTPGSPSPTAGSPTAGSPTVGSSTAGPPPSILLPAAPIERLPFALTPPIILTAATDLRAAVAALRDRALSGGLGLSAQMTGHGAPHESRLFPLCGLALYAPGGPPLYLPVGHRYLGVPAQHGRDEVLAVLLPLLSDPAIPKYVYGAKDAYLALTAFGLPLVGLRADPALCSYLLDAGADHALPALCARFLDAAVPLRTRQDLRAGQGPGKKGVTLETFEIDAVGAIAAAEAQAALVLAPLLRDRLDEASRLLLDDLELPLSQVLAKIECHGVLLDTSVLRRLSLEVDDQLRALEAEVQKEAGSEINLGSPKQLQELLFEKLKLPPGKKTKTGYSTDAEVLEALAAQNPIAKKIHEHRGLAKLKNTYIDQLPGLVDARTGRLHTSYNQVVAATGRLSSTEPNLQNVPIRTDLGRQIRRAFIAPPGYVLLTADYSQIELRVLAHLSKDPLLVKSFQNGEDVHERTAIEMFGPEAGKRPEMRRAAKMINYGIVYGLTDYGLSVRLSIERTVAKTYIKEYFDRYSGVQRFMEELVNRARQDGGARTLLGRFRPLPDIGTRNYQARAYAERMAKNTPIQGTAADILKRAMIDVQRRLETEKAAEGTRMLLTVHDELVLEAPEGREAAIRDLVKDAMEHAFTLSVPLQVDVGAGKNWADCD